jgi:hypothetical protein
VGNENSDAQNNEEHSYSFKHRRILRNPITKGSAFCTVKEIPLSGLNFPPLGPRPWLHQLRSRLPGFVRWLHSYYGGVNLSGTGITD